MNTARCSYDEGCNVTLSGDKGIVLSGQITKQLRLGVNRCQVVQIKLLASSRLPTGVNLPNVVVAKVYDPHFLRISWNPKATLEERIEYAAEICDTEATAYKTLVVNAEVRKRLAPFYGVYKFKVNKDSEEYCAILLGFCAGISPYDLSQTIAAEVVKQLRDFLNQCHALGVAHCDIKAHNLFVNDKGDLLFLFDWAFAALRSAVSANSFIDGCKSDIRALRTLAMYMTEEPETS